VVGLIMAFMTASFNFYDDDSYTDMPYVESKAKKGDVGNKDKTNEANSAEVELFTEKAEEVLE
jgi:hypothetical protein